MERVKTTLFTNFQKNLISKLVQIISSVSGQTKFTHFFISSFQICPGRQNFEGSVPLFGHSGRSLPKTDEEKIEINTEVTMYRIIFLTHFSILPNRKLVFFIVLTRNTTNFYFSLGVMIIHVVDEDAYNLPVSISIRLPTATPVDLPECSTIPMASTVSPVGIGRIIFTLNSSVV